MALGGEWIMSIKPIVDSIQFVLEIVIIAIFIVRIYVKKKKRISVKKYNRVIIICVICWLVLGISMQIISFSTLEAAMAFQGEDISGAKVVYGEDAALVARVKDGTIVFDAFLQEHGKWKMSNYIFAGQREYSTDCPNTEDYTIFFERYRMSGGIYVTVMDHGTTYQEEKRVSDSEGTHFETICANLSENRDRMYFGYIEDVPESYEIMVNKEQLLFDWGWAFEFLT